MPGQGPSGSGGKVVTATSRLNVVFGGTAHFAGAVGWSHSTAGPVAFSAIAGQAGQGMGVWNGVRVGLGVGVCVFVAVGHGPGHVVGVGVRVLVGVEQATSGQGVRVGVGVAQPLTLGTLPGGHGVFVIVGVGLAVRDGVAVGVLALPDNWNSMAGVPALASPRPARSQRPAATPAAISSARPRTSSSRVRSAAVAIRLPPSRGSASGRPGATRDGVGYTTRRWQYT